MWLSLGLAVSWWFVEISVHCPAHVAWRTCLVIGGYSLYASWELELEGRSVKSLVHTEVGLCRPAGSGPQTQRHCHLVVRGFKCIWIGAGQRSCEVNWLGKGAGFWELGEGALTTPMASGVEGSIEGMCLGVVTGTGEGIISGSSLSTIMSRRGRQSYHTPWLGF